jgi:hypothetical protein
MITATDKKIIESFSLQLRLRKDQSIAVKYARFREGFRPLGDSPLRDLIDFRRKRIPLQ